jgi:hypothetical protein
VDVLAHTLQCLDRLGGAVSCLPQRDPLERKQIPLVDDSAQAAVVDDDRCRTPRSAITCIASDAVADAGSVTSGAVITSARGVSSPRPGSTTRRNRSTRVNIPIGASSRPRAMIVRTLASAIFCTASRSVSVAGHATGALRTSSASVRARSCCSAARWLYWLYRLSSDCLSVSVIACVQ